MLPFGFIRALDLCANLIIIGCCLWAVLDEHINTRFIGTTALSCLALAAAVSLVPPDVITPIYREVQTWRHIAVAWFGGWIYAQNSIDFARR